MNDKAPRSMGRLTAGELKYEHEIFSTVFLYECDWQIGDDEIKSATIAVAKKLQELLSRNGFWRYSTPNVGMEKVGTDGKTVVFRVAVRTMKTESAGRPTVLHS